MTKDTIPDNFTVKMAIVDAFPVIFFGLATILLGLFLKSPLFVIGAVCCAFAGITKVLWKFIVAIKRKNIWWMFIQMRILMPIGFILMIVGVFLGRSYLTFEQIVQWFTSFPVNIFFGIGLLSMIVMTVLAFVLDNTNPKHNWIEQIVNGVGQFFILIGAVLLAYFGNFYNSMMTAGEYAKEYSGTTINIEETDDYYMVSNHIGVGENAIIFFPGAKVEATAYIPLMQEIVNDDTIKVTCFIVKPSYNFALLGSSIADEIYEQYKGKFFRWYLAGHSLGGVAASNYLSQNSQKFNGLILMASYSVADLVAEDVDLNTDIKVLSILASNDAVMNLEAEEANRGKLPDDTVFYIIEGGNHGQFGDYGKQEGDDFATISKENQWDQIGNQIIDFLKEK